MNRVVYASIIVAALTTAINTTDCMKRPASTLGSTSSTDAVVVSESALPGFEANGVWDLVTFGMEKDNIEAVNSKILREVKNWFTDEGHTAVSFEGIKLSGEDLDLIGRALAQNPPKLKILNLANTSINPFNISYILDALTCVYDTYKGELVSGNNTLTKLDIRHNDIGASGVRAIADAFTCTYYGDQLVRGNTTLERLKLRPDDISDAETRAMIQRAFAWRQEGDMRFGNDTLTIPALGINANGRKRPPVSSFKDTPPKRQRKDSANGMKRALESDFEDIPSKKPKNDSASLNAAGCSIQ